MKITIYTIKDCAFSKQEKEYLNTNKLVFEEKDLETNKDFLTEMLAISNNFAGTPITRVEKDDGTIAVLKGFTKDEFDKTFGLAVAPTTGSESLTPTTDSTVPVANDTPIPPPIETVSPTPIAIDNQSPVTNNETPAPTTPADPLKSIMDDLQAKAEPVTPVVEQPPVVPPVTNDQPATPPPADVPAIPDFPAK